MGRWIVGWSLFALLVTGLAGCGGAGATGTAPSPTRATATLAPTFTVLPTLTLTPLPTYTPWPTHTPFPTWTPPPSPTTTPVPTATPIAVVPEVSADWPTTVRRAADTLRGDPIALAQILTRLGAITGSEGAVRALDLTHDGGDDLLVWYIDPAAPDPATRGNLLILTHDGTSWRPLFDATLGSAGSAGARLLEARDLNNDRQIEIAYALTACGATACSTSVRVGVWAGNTLRDLTASEIRLPSLRAARFSDSDGDGMIEMALSGGTLPGAEIGPQRERTDVYGWGAGGYVLVESHYAATDLLPLIVWEANDALEAGDPQGARALYERAVQDETLRPWARGGGDLAVAAAERDLLRAFSRFRLTVIAAGLADRAGAQQWRDALRAHHPDSPYRQAAELFLERWPAAGLAPACEAVNELAARNIPTMVDPLNDFGITGPQFAPQEICPLR